MNKDPFEKQLEDAKSERENAGLNNPDGELLSQNQSQTDRESNRGQDETPKSSTFGRIGSTEAYNDANSEFPFVKLSVSSIAIYLVLTAMYGQPIFPMQWLIPFVLVLGLTNSYLESVE